MGSAQPTLAEAASVNGMTQALPTPTPTPTPTPAVPTAPTASGQPAPTLALANDSYTDSGNTSHKKITFDVTVPIPLDEKKFALVNKIQGTGKLADGTFWKLYMYGSIVDANFPTTQVDSVDPDPVYWSKPISRWNYTSTAAGFSATDDPGPPGYTFAKGDATKFKFKMGVYGLSDLPITTTGSLSAKPLDEKDWQYSVAADPVSGALSHPAL